MVASGILKSTPPLQLLPQRPLLLPGSSANLYVRGLPRCAACRSPAAPHPPLAPATAPAPETGAYPAPPTHVARLSSFGIAATATAAAAAFTALVAVLIVLRRQRLRRQRGKRGSARPGSSIWSGNKSGLHPWSLTDSYRTAVRCFLLWPGCSSSLTHA